MRHAGNVNRNTNAKAYMLYEIAVKTLPSHAEQLEGKPEKLALPLTQVIAESDNGAIFRAGVENADALRKEKVELSRAVIVLRRVG